MVAKRSQGDIERYLTEHPEFPKTVHFIFLKFQFNQFLRKIWPPSYYWYYRYWHKKAYDLAVKLHHEVNFDIAHQLTMVGFREPGYLWKLGIPFVWGPVGGMGFFPWQFLHKVGLHGAIFYLGYNLYNFLQMRFMKRPKIAARIAGCGLMTATQENQTCAHYYWGCPSTIIPEVGLPHLPVTDINQRNLREPLRIVWTGLHEARKALNLGLDALNICRSDINWELHILGNGPRKNTWMRQAESRGIFKRTFFHGWLSRDQALKVMSRAHVMLITSLRDLTSTVTIEALALGLPIVCLDHCGFADVINEYCGIKVPVTKYNQVVKGLAKALESLADDEILRQKLAKGALARAQMYSWENKIDMLCHIYSKRLNKGQDTK